MSTKYVPKDGVTQEDVPTLDQPAVAIPVDTQVSPGVEPGTVVAGKFRVERVINSGGMGVILVAHHLQLDQRVAIKVLRAHVLHDPEIVARFAREARVLAKIKSEHVVRVIDVGSLQNGLPYMVMEHLQGSDLSALVKARGPMPYEEVVEYILQACEPLAEAHVAGVVHRDLKPANLFLTRRPDGTPLLKVLDFGISKVVDSFDPDSNMTKTSMIMGSPQYMSPEQLRSARKVDGRADIWALGVVIYRLISGRNPFRADSTPDLVVEILHGDPLPLRQLAPDVPEGLERIVERCLQKKPKDRFSNVAELARALQPFAPARAAATVARAEGVYKSSAGASRDVPSSSDPIDATDTGARTMSEKSVAPSVSERTGSRKSMRLPFFIGVGAASVVAAIFGFRQLTAAPVMSATSRTEAPATTTAPSVLPAASQPTIDAVASASVAVPASTAKPIVTHVATARVMPSAKTTTSSTATNPTATNPESHFGGPF